MQELQRRVHNEPIKLANGLANSQYKINDRGIPELNLFHIPSLQWQRHKQGKE